MTKFSLAFLVKRSIRVTFLILICLVLLSQIFLSLYLFQYTLKVVSQIDPAIGKISVGAVSFDVINGYNLHDVYIMDNSKPAQVLFFAKRLTFYFDPIDMLSKKLNIKRLKLQKAVFYVDKSSGSVAKLIKLCQAAYYKFLENQILPMEIGLNNPKIILKKAKVFFVDWSDVSRGFWVLNLTSSTSVEGKEIISSGDSNIKYAFAKGANFDNFFNNQIFNQDFDYQFKANFTDSDFTLEMFDLTLGYDHIRGQAILKNFNKPNPMLNLIVNSSNISLESVSSLARNFDTHGSFNISAIVRGPLENAKFILGLNFLGCSLQFPQISYLKNIVGKVYWLNDSIKLDNIFLIINDLPLKLNSEFSSVRNSLKLSAQVSLRDDTRKIALLPKVLEIDFSGNKQDNIFTGDSNFLVKAQDLNTYSFRLGGFKFSQIAGIGMVSAKDLNFSSWPTLDENAPLKRLNFSNFSTGYSVKKEALKIEDTKLEGLSGEVSGNFIFNFLPNYKYNLKLAAENLDTSHIQDGLKLPYNLLGTASAKAFSNSGSNNFLEGIILVKDGRLQDTAVLLALSNYMNIASLRAIEFDNLQLSYSFLKGGLYRYGLRSTGKRAIIKANIHVDKNNEVSGYFKARLSRDLLTESPKFRKLLKILGDKSKFVEFPFILSGTIHNPRLQWLANDFKRSLERRIPAWYRRNMQKAIDEAVDEMNSGGS